ncbi:DUF2255 family protein [Amycolatopsis sp. NPDC023774]|uniref:DUF2255 family protein n=1 Tax=Amycolatopsis sp. NPDC023774 TaxID=3155015 RepID=UPI0033F251E8
MEVGFVLFDGTLFVRAVRGPVSRWFQAASNHRGGRIRVDSLSRAVVFAADGEDPAGIDEAYRAKFASRFPRHHCPCASRDAPEHH